MKRLFGLPWRTARRIAEEAESEFLFHIAARTERLMAQGLSPDAARAQAFREFGDMDDARRYIRRVDRQAEAGRRRRDVVGEFLQDLRYATRRLRAAPTFGAIAVVSLAIAVGVNVTAFSLLDALLFRDLPGVVRQHELSAVLKSYESRFGRTSPSHLSMLEWEIFRGAIPGFSRSAVTGVAPVALRIGGEPRVVRGDFVSGDFFAMLGTRPAAGRLLTTDDDRAGAPPVAVISYALWTAEFDSTADVVGKPLFVGNVPFTIVGVMPKGFVGLYPGELDGDLEHGAPWVMVPLSAAPLVRLASRATDLKAILDDDWLVFFGRRKPGVSPRAITAHANAVAARVAAAYPAERKSARAEARDVSTGTTAELLAISLASQALPALILLVACANLANQLLARAVQRRREIAVRLSLGATRARLVRQLLVESTLLTALASLAGIALARVLVDFVSRSVMVMPFRVPIDARVLAFTAGLAALTSLAFGLLPALRATRMDLSQAVKDGGRAGGYRHSRLRGALVVVQVATSVAFIALAGVFLRGARRARISDTGANADRIVTLAVDLNLLGFTPDAGRAFLVRAADRLGALPGVEAVAIVPFRPAEQATYLRVRVVGDAPDRKRWEHVAEASGDWFAVQNSRVLAGRLFTPAESRSRAPVAVVDAAEARYLWPGASPIGQTITIGEPCDVNSASDVCIQAPGAASRGVTVATVIGVVPTIVNARAERPSGVVIVPAPETYRPRSVLYARARGSAAALKPSVRNAMRELDPRMPLRAVETLGDALDARGDPVAQMAAGVGAMGVVALLLSALGIAAVLSFAVEQRRHEIGVRMALGARPRAVQTMILRQSLALVIAGVVIGALLAAAGATTVRGILFGLPPIDPIAFTASTVIIVAVALASSAGPARRAARVEPLVALRGD
jgi:putative ABC transport system permease protein